MYVPTPHSVGAVEPSGQYEPTVHAVQPEESLRPVAAE